MFLIISSSLNPNSNSKKLGLFLKSVLDERNTNCEFVDLKECNLPLCDGASSYDNDNVKILNDKIRDAQTILICSPIYNFDLNAAIKNVLELTGSSWKKKQVGFLCAAGGKSSYMSPISFMNSLMLDYRCIIIPRFVYALGGDFDKSKVISQDIKERIISLAEESIYLNKKLK